MLSGRLETVPEESRQEVQRRLSQAEVAPVGQTFVANLYREGDDLVQTLLARDQQVVSDMCDLQVRNKELEEQLGAAHQKFENARVHIEDLQTTAAAVTARLGRELTK